MPSIRAPSALLGLLLLGSGIAWSATLTAATCATTDIQAQITAAASGDTVLIPNGTCTWSSTITLSGKGLILRGQSEAGVVITNTAVPGIHVTEDTAVHTQIAYLTASGSGRLLDINPHSTPTDDGKAVLVHHLTLHNTSGIRLLANRGVVYLNTITGESSLSGNLEFLQCVPDALTTSWTTPSSMGTNDTTGEMNVYVEDNVFTKVFNAAIDTDSNCRLVMRHNTFDNSALGSHGADTSLWGGRHFELYDNTFIFTNFGDCDGSQTLNIPFFLFLRGGTGVITNNAGFADMTSCSWGAKPALNMTVMNLRRNAGPNPCWGQNSSGGAKYPAPRQIGRGYVTGAGTDGTGRTTDSVGYVGDAEPLYLWNQSPMPAHSLSDYPAGDAQACAGVPTNYDQTSTYIVAGRDVIRDGTAKPGWTRYPYPHPLIAALAGGTPASIVPLVK